MTKRGVLLLFMVFSARVVWGQYPPVLVPVPATKLEAFANRKNVLLTTESYFVPGISGDNGCRVRFQAVILYEVGQESQKVRGLKIEVTEGQRGKEERSVISYVDFDELDGLSKAITTMLDMTHRGSALPNPIAKELSFSTVGGLTLSMVQRDRERHLFISHQTQPDAVCTVSAGSAIVEFKTSVEMAMQSIR